MNPPDRVKSSLPRFSTEIARFLRVSFSVEFKSDVRRLPDTAMVEPAAYCPEHIGDRQAICLPTEICRRNNDLVTRNRHIVKYDQNCEALLH